MWSDESGLKECTKGNTHPPSPQWSWVGGILRLKPSQKSSCTHISSYSYYILFHHQLILCHHSVFQVSEWSVDYNVPGGTDKEGWQYAADFPVYVTHFLRTQRKKTALLERGVQFISFLSLLLQDISWPQNHERLCQAQKMDEVVTLTHVTHFCGLQFPVFCSIKMIVCSTYRKCKITLRGPWQQVPPIPLSDISLMPCLAQSRMEQVPVWALSDKGDVLCRLGVSPQNPAVRNK